MKLCLTSFARNPRVVGGFRLCALYAGEGGMFNRNGRQCAGSCSIGLFVSSKMLPPSVLIVREGVVNSSHDLKGTSSSRFFFWLLASLASSRVSALLLSLVVQSAPTLWREGTELFPRVKTTDMCCFGKDARHHVRRPWFQARTKFVQFLGVRACGSKGAEELGYAVRIRERKPGSPKP